MAIIARHAFLSLFIFVLTATIFFAVFAVLHNLMLEFLAGYVGLITVGGPDFPPIFVGFWAGILTAFAFTYIVRYSTSASKLRNIILIFVLVTVMIFSYSLVSYDRPHDGPLPIKF